MLPVLSSRLWPRRASSALLLLTLSLCACQRPVTQTESARSAPVSRAPVPAPVPAPEAPAQAWVDELIAPAPQAGAQEEDAAQAPVESALPEATSGEPEASAPDAAPGGPPEADASAPPSSAPGAERPPGGHAGRAPEGSGRPEASAPPLATPVTPAAPLGERLTPVPQTPAAPTPAEPRAPEAAPTGALPGALPGQAAPGSPEVEAAAPLTLPRTEPEPVPAAPAPGMGEPLPTPPAPAGPGPAWPAVRDPQALAGALAPAQVRRFGPRAPKRVAITFDDGPSPRYTGRVLDIAAREGVPLTFFVVGREIDGREALLRRMVAEGHEVGNHTWDHVQRRVTQAVAAQQVDRTSDLITSVTGRPVTLFRPPGGRLETGVALRASDSGLQVVNWEATAEDWQKGKTRDQIVRLIVGMVRPGSVILLHDGGGNREATLAAFPIIIETLRAKGYEFVTTTELLGH